MHPDPQAKTLTIRLHRSKQLSTKPSDISATNSTAPRRLPSTELRLIYELALSLVGAIGSSATFWLFAAFSVVGWVWVYVYVPETKGQSLEQIQQIWKTLRK